MIRVIINNKSVEVENDSAFSIDKIYNDKYKLSSENTSLMIGTFDECMKVLLDIKTSVSLNKDLEVKL